MMFDYSTPDMAGPSTQPPRPIDVLQLFCYECNAFDVYVSGTSMGRCKHNLRMLPEENETYEMLKYGMPAPTSFVTPTETILSTPSVPQVGGASTHAPPSSLSPPRIPLPESGEENDGEEEEEGDAEDAYVVEPPEPAHHGESDNDDWGVMPAHLRTRSGRAAFLRGITAMTPPTTVDGVSTRAPSPSAATGDEDGDYSTDSEVDGTFEEVPCEGHNISDREVTGDIAEEVQASAGDEDEYDPDTEEDEVDAAPTQVGSRNRAKRTRDVWGNKRGKTLVPATAEDLAGYPGPAEVLRTILGSGKSWVRAADATFPVGQRVLITKHRGKEDWECRLKLAIPRTGEVCWVYNPVPCPKALNRDGYIRHVLDSHLGVERASGGSTRQDQIKKALKRCIAASTATRRGKRDRQEDSEPGPSRKRMRES